MESKLLNVYWEHGCEKVGASGDTHDISDCPFCGRERKFFIRRDNGQFKCHVCGEAGNSYTYMSKVLELYRKQLDARQLRRLANFRGLPKSAFTPDLCIGFDGEAFILPQRNEKGSVINLVRWSGPGARMYSTKGCNKSLLGIEELAKATKKKRVWICAGEWDRIAMRWLLSTQKRNDLVIAPPSESMWKDEWTGMLAGHDVVIAYDADDAGDKGSAKVGRKLKGVAKSVSYVCWREDAPEGFDINDWVSHGFLEHRDKLDDVLEALESLISADHRKGGAEGMGTENEDTEKITDQSQRPERIPEWEEILTAFRRHIVSSPDLEMALTLSAACVFASQYENNPPWVFIVGPPGGGKTTVINATIRSHKTHAISSLTPKALISGWEKTNKDESVLPKLRYKCGVFKDATEILKGDFRELNELFGILRGAFDGSVQRSYGNGVLRSYSDLWFTLLLGVTPAIERASQADLGERFLRFRLPGLSEDAALDHVAATMTGGRITDAEDLQRLMADFLWEDLPPEEELPHFTRSGLKKFQAMARVVARLRYVPAFEMSSDGQRLQHEVYHEAPTRVFAQMFRLVRIVAHIHGHPTADRELSFARRLAEDSCSWAFTDIVKALRSGESLTAAELVERTGSGTHYNTMLFHCKAMQATGFLQKLSKSTGGRPASAWSLRSDFVKLLAEAGMWRQS